VTKNTPTIIITTEINLDLVSFSFKINQAKIIVVTVANLPKNPTLAADVSAVPELLKNEPNPNGSH